MVTNHFSSHNATILSLLTVSEQTEKVFFAYAKEVHDVAPAKIYWYPNAGENGNAMFRWQDKKIKQWMLVGADQDIKEIWRELMSPEGYHASWSNGKTLRFVLPSVTKRNSSNSIYEIGNVCMCGRNEAPDEYQCKTFLSDISFLVNEETNCSFLEGYKMNTVVRSVDPPGLFGEKMLFNKLKDKVCAVYKSRGLHWTLRGIRSSNPNDIDQLKGFIQAGKGFRAAHRICIKDLEGDRILGKSEIDPITGEWTTSLAEPVWKGQFLIEEKATKKIYCGEKFYLLKEITVNTEMITTVIKDLYGREISLSSSPKVSEPIKETVIWDATAFPESVQSEIELSDKLKNILLTLGDRVIFNDPYFFGNIEIENGQIKLPSKSQHIFFNALITCIAANKIQEISIVGSWKKMKKVANDKNEFIRGYKALYQLIQHNFRKSEHYVPKKFNLVLSEQIFHDRYWLNMTDIMYHISNSINGAFENNELRVSLADDIDKMKIIPRISARLEEEIIDLTV